MSHYYDKMCPRCYPDYGCSGELCDKHKPAEGSVAWINMSMECVEIIEYFRHNVWIDRLALVKYIKIKGKGWVCTLDEIIKRRDTP